MAVREVSANVLIKQLSEELKGLKELTPPEWSRFVKTGAHKERHPERPDWWHTRAASLLRRIYLNGPIGVSRLRTYYGGRQRRGSAPDHSRRGGGKVLRVILQQLEQAGLVTKVGRGGRGVTLEGAKMLSRIADKLKSGEPKVEAVGK